MYLSIDEQTISDLGIFSKGGKPSVFDRYNNTVTQGGGRKLETLFRHPLSDEILINERSAVYRFFSASGHAFPVDSATVSTVAYYMENDDVRTQLQMGGQSLGRKFRDMVATDADQVFVHDGVQATIRLFNAIIQFTEQIKDEVIASAYLPYFNSLKELMNASGFKQVRDHCVSKFEVKLSTIVLAELDKLIRFEQRENILQLLDTLYELDVFMSVGQTARKYGYHFADAQPKHSGALAYRGVYHPHVQNAIPNDLFLNTEHNILFLTGANMAGKSTLMKSVGIALYLAHMGFPVAAQQFSFAVRDGIVTSINLADNLNAGASHYYAEVLRVKEVALQLQQGRHLFVIFDEMFRGTNVKDAYDATIALTAAFAAKKGSQFIISTHIMEAGEVLLQKASSIRYQYLPTVMEGNLPTYPRILVEGITADRQGMVIIQNEGILEMLDAGINMEEDL